MKSFKNLKEEMSHDKDWGTPGSVKHAKKITPGQKNEGTWAIPKTPKDKAALSKLMSQPIKLGKEGDEAAGKIYSLIGDDELFDDLYVAGKKNPNGDARPIIKKHMKRLKISESKDFTLIEDIRGEITQLQKMLKSLERGKKTPGRGFAKMRIKELIADLEKRQSQDDAVMKLRNEEKDPNEYDKEGEMMKNQLRQICSANEKLMKMVGDDDNLPEWVQNKVTKATDYIRSVRDYLEAENGNDDDDDDEEEMDEAKDPRLARAGVSGFNKAKRTPGHPKKSHIVVAKDGNKVKTIRFGQQGAETAGDPKKGESDRMKKKRASFKARHGKNIAKGKMSAAYWANKEKW